MNNNQNKDNDKLDMQSPDLVNQNIEKLAELFPNCVTESANGKAIDFDLLKQELNHAVVEGNKERYRLEWPGKREAIVTANLPTTKTLRPVREDSVDFDNTENIYIEGDNLEVLKLLQECYLNKIKMIYIDPPYNTGNDFVYKDNFAKDKEDELFESGQKDELSQRLVINPEASGRYHSDWLSMIYPRLKLARNLLTDDGVIFISIDDNEINNLVKMCDEVFGEGNFVGQFTLQSNPRGSQSSKHLASVHEYILMYCKDTNNLNIGGFEKSESAISEYSEVDDKGRKYRLLGLRQRGGAWRREDRPKMYYPIYVDPNTLKVSLVKSSEFHVEVLPKRPTGEESRWTWSKEKLIKDLHFVRAKKINRAGESESYDIFRFDYLENDLGSVKTTKPKTMWYEKEVNYQNGRVSINELFGNSDIFDYPKPTYIVKQLSAIAGLEDDLLLDFFSGSSTSAQALMELNLDGIARKFIMVQLPELTDEKSEAYKAGYKTIAEIGKERIRRAAKKIKEDTDADIDYGFRVYRLDESNMQDVYYRPQDFDQAKMDLFGDNVKPDRTEDDLLAQVMLDWGLPLSLTIEQANVAGKKVFKVADNSLFACFDRDIDEAFAKEIAKEKPLRIVFKDAGFKDDTAKTNVKQLLKQLSPETEMKVL